MLHVCSIHGGLLHLVYLRCIRNRTIPFPTAIFFSRVILYNFFLFLLIYGGLGFWGWGLILGFLGWGFQLMGFGDCVVII